MLFARLKKVWYFPLDRKCKVSFQNCVCYLGRIKISIKEPRSDDLDLVIMLSDLRQILVVARN